MPGLTSTVVRVTKNSPTREITEHLLRDGAVIIQDLEDPAVLSAVEKELEPEFDAAKAVRASKKTGGGYANAFPVSTDRVEIIGRSVTADKLLMNSKVNSVLQDVLAEEFPFYFGETRYRAVSKPQVAAALAIKCYPGNAAQGLHRDDTFNHTIHPGPESQVTAIWAATPATKENGATEAILGSHRWDLEENPNLHRDELIQAEMSPGSVLLIVGGLYHAGGSNRTTDQTRVLYTFFYNKGYLRQEENQYLQVPREVVRTKSKDVQEMLGYFVSKPGAGYYKGGDPKLWLRDPGEDVSDLETSFFE